MIRYFIAPQNLISQNNHSQTKMESQSTTRELVPTVQLRWKTHQVSLDGFISFSVQVTKPDLILEQLWKDKFSDYTEWVKVEVVE